MDLNLLYSLSRIMKNKGKPKQEKPKEPPRKLSFH